MRVASTLLLLSSLSAAAGEGLGPFDAPPVEDTISDPEDPMEPVAHDLDIANSLIVSYASDEGLSAIASHVEDSKAKGRSVSLRAGAGQRYGRKVKKGGRKGGAGRSAPSGGGEEPSEKGDGRNKRKKGGRGGRTRFLQSDTEDETAGYAVLDVGSELEAEAEMYELIGINGVTMVEQDVEYEVEEVASLRGVKNEMEEIMDSVNELEERHLQTLTSEKRPYGIDMVNITHLWNVTPKQHVKICVIDTGYALGHEDLPDNVTYPVTGWDSGVASKGVWNIDGHSHGTHCAGTIGAIGNQIGVVGVNPDPARFSFHIGKGLSDSGSGSGSDVVNAVKDCVANGAHVISMSLGCSNCFVNAYDQIYRDAYDAGTLIVAAAGNSASDTAHYPSGYESVISVASVAEGGGPGTANYGQLSYFSTRNDQTEIAGPGHYVYSTVPDNKGRYGTKSGTSMACPHVAGVAAWLISHFPDCTNNQIRNAMVHSTREPPTGDWRNTKGWDKYYGWGIVNAGQAYERLLEGCESAGGAFPAANQTLSEMAQGGKDQKDIGCTNDFQCADENLCNGNRKCDLSTNTCYVEEGTAVTCDDGNICTTDTCNPSTGTCDFTDVVCEDGNKCNGIKKCNNVTGTCDLVQDPVNCDDGNACTINKCITSTGLCQTSDKVCNDGNACTFNDSCDTSTGCIFEAPQPDCCGNAVCESSETEQTCPLDCSTSLTTDISATNNRYGYLGNYFNVRAKSDSDVAITGFGVNCVLPPEKAATAYVWARTGSFYKDENGYSVWYKRDKFTLYQKSSIVCSGEVGKLTNITLGGEAGQVKVSAGTVTGFNVYILTDDISNDYPMVRSRYVCGDKVGGVYAEDSYLSIGAGGGNACTSGWCSMGMPIRFSGSLYYAVLDGSSASTAAPPGAGDTTTTTTTAATTTTTTTTTTDGTVAPSSSPIPTQSPSKSPTDQPTKGPTPSPTSHPTVSPTDSPSNSPTESPTPAPTVSLSPTEFVPEVVELVTGSTSSATVLRSAYFEVTTGSEWAKIVDLMITTYRTRALQVYVKDGKAADYEQVPCSWKKIAETSASWNESRNSYWKKVYPPWVNGFEPVVMEPFSKKSFYVVNLYPGYGILGKRFSYSDKYKMPYLESPLTNVTMSVGKGGYNDPFKVYPYYYSPYGIFGGLKLESVQHGTTHTPTASPTAPSDPGNDLVSFHDVTSSFLKPHGIQFDVKNIHPDDNLFVTEFKLYLAGTGTKSVEVWMRTGSHDGATGNCKNYNNWCKQWKQLASGDVSSSGSTTLTTTPKFVAIVPVGETVSFALVSGNSGIVTRAVVTGDAAAENDHLSLGFGTQIIDYYGDNVQTSETPGGADAIFHGTMTYTIAYSDCAILSTAPWVDPDPGASSTSGMSSASSSSNADDGGESGPQSEELVYWSDSFEDEEPPLLGGGPVNGDDSGGPIMSSIQEIVG